MRLNNPFNPIIQFSLVTTTSSSTTTITTTTTTTTTQGGVEVRGGPCENPRYLSSSKAENFEFVFFDGGREGRPSDLYYPLVADKNHWQMEECREAL